MKYWKGRRSRWRSARAADSKSQTKLRRVATNVANQNQPEDAAANAAGRGRGGAGRGQNQPEDAAANAAGRGRGGAGRGQNQPIVPVANPAGRGRGGAGRGGAGRGGAGRGQNQPIVPVANPAGRGRGGAGRGGAGRGQNQPNVPVVNRATAVTHAELGGKVPNRSMRNDDPNRFLQYDSSLVNPYPQRYGDMNCVSLTICSLLHYWEEAGPTIAKRYFDLYGKDIDISFEITQKKVSTVLPNVALKRLRSNEFNVYTWPVICPTVVNIENDLIQRDHCMGILGSHFFDSCNNFTLPRRPECANHICRPNKYKRFTCGFQLIVKKPTRNEKMKLARKRRREKAKASLKRPEGADAFAGTPKKQKPS